MIAFHDVDGDTCLGKSCGFADKEESGAGIRPVAIPEVAGDEHEGDPLLNSELDEISKGVASGRLNPLYWCALELHESAKRTIKMDIGGVDELEHVITVKAWRAPNRKSLKIWIFHSKANGKTETGVDGTVTAVGERTMSAVS
jgi:hypothetical protein